MPPSILAHIMSLVSPYSERARLQLVNPNFKSVVNVWMSWTDITSVEIKCKCESNKVLSCVFNGGSATRKETISSGMQPTLADKENSEDRCVPASQISECPQETPEGNFGRTSCGGRPDGFYSMSTSDCGLYAVCQAGEPFYQHCRGALVFHPGLHKCKPVECDHLMSIS